jgi:hypothetical protein
MPVAQQHAVTQQELAEALDKFRFQLLADIQALISIPLDDEPLTDAERDALQEAIDDPGPNIPHQEVLREFGL